MHLLKILFKRSTNTNRRSLSKRSKTLSLESLEQRIALDASGVRPQLEPVRQVYIDESLVGLKANSPPCKNIVIQFTRLIVRLCAGAHFFCLVPAALLPVSCIHTTHSCDNNRMPTVQKFPRR